MENLNATERFLEQLNPSNLVNTIFCLVQYLKSAGHELLRIYFLRNLFAVKSQSKHSKFGGPPCWSTQNATR